jgi:hypothetical protein
MSNCPEPYRSNCRWLDIQCSRCRAGEGNDSFFYRPITTLYPSKNHPFYIEEKLEEDLARKEARELRKASSSYKRGKSNYREGIKGERKSLKDIGARSTIGSGAVCGDGDGVLVIGGESFSIEHKSRLGATNKLSVTKQEWEKGKRQGIDLFLISSNEQRIVLMDYEVFIRLRNLALDGKEGID